MTKRPHFTLIDNTIDTVLIGNMRNPLKIVFFVHGFGSSANGGQLTLDRYDTGFVPALADSCNEDNLFVSFNFANIVKEYDQVLEDYVDRQYYPTLSEMKQILATVVETMSRVFPEATRSFIAHSMGTHVLMDYLTDGRAMDISEVVLLAVPLSSNVERSRERSLNKAGSYSEGDTDFLMRSDGSQTVVTADFWEQRRKLGISRLVNAVNNMYPGKVAFVAASSDTVLYPELAQEPIDERLVEDLLENHYEDLLDLIVRAGNEFALIRIPEGTSKGHDFQGRYDDFGQDYVTAEELIKYVSQLINSERKIQENSRELKLK